LGLTLLILGIIFYGIDLRELGRIVLQSNKLLLVASTVIGLVVFPVISTLRWQNTLRILDYRLHFSFLYRIYLATLPLAKVTPANSGDFMKAYYMKEEVPPSLNAGGILMERMLDIMVLSLAALISGIYVGSAESIAVGIGVFILLALMFLFARYYRTDSENKWLARIKKLFTVFRICTRHPGLFLRTVFYSVLLWASILLLIKLLFLSFGADISYVRVVALQPVSIFIGLLPITLSGIGTREAAMLYLYQGIAANPIIVATGIYYSFFGSVLFPLIGLPLLYKLNQKPKTTP